jgi:Flp pilus assembly protein TadB
LEILAAILVAFAVALIAWPGLQRRLWSSQWVALRRDFQRSQRTGGMSRLLRSIGAAEADALCRQAGRPRGLTGQTFLVVQWGLALFTALLMVPSLGPVFGLAAGAMAWYVARFWLKATAESRHKQIGLELPTFLDLWSLLVANGATVEGGLVTIVRHHPEWLLSAEMRLVLDRVAASQLLGESLTQGARETGVVELVTVAEQVRQLVDGGGAASQELSRIAQRLRDERLDQLIQSTGTAAIVGIFPKLFAVFLSLTPVIASIFITVIRQM